jgi:hypothetical protein
MFIPGNVPSSKNSKIHTRAGGVFMSATVQKYLREIGIVSFSSSKKTVKEYKNRKNLFKINTENEFKESFDFTKGDPCVLGIHFVRGTKHKFDMYNIFQIIADLLVAHNIIPDDNMDYLIPMPMKLDNRWYSYDKDNPGVILDILNPNIIKNV